MSPDDPTPKADPAAEAPSQYPLVVVPLSPEDAKTWQGEITRSDTRRKIFEKSWEQNLSDYAPDPTNEKWGTEINPGIAFFVVEQKKAQLFFDTPEVILKPGPKTDPQTAQQITDQQTRLNRKLGRDGLDAKRLMDKVSFDMLCPSGEAWVKVGYTNVSTPQQIQRPTPWTPMGVPPPEPQMATVQVPIFEEIFAERFSPKQGLKPTNFHDTEFDKAPWLGEKFAMPLRVARRQFSLPPDFNPKAKTDDLTFKQAGVPTDSGDTEQVTGTALWYKASLYDDSVQHPQKIRELVFIDGIPEPVVHRDSPYQTFDQSGQLTPDSLIGFPIEVFTIRDLADSAFVPSDCTVIRPLVNEISRFRTQLVEHRDASTSVRIADETKITTEVLNKIIRSPYGAILPIANYDANLPPIMEIGKPALSRENFQSQEVIDNDLSKVTALSANQTGTNQDNVHSATEIQTIQSNANVRMEAERNRLISRFLALVRKLDVLTQRYPDRGDPKLTLPRYTYAIKPDSGMHIDAAADRKFALDRYNFLAKDPNCNRSYLLQETAVMLHLDPLQLIVQPPPPGPPPPKVSVILKGDDLSPLAPQYPNMLQIAQQGGFKLTETPLTPEMVANASAQQAAQHPGTAPKGDMLSKHSAETTGQVPNQGGLA